MNVEEMQDAAHEHRGDATAPGRTRGQAHIY